jgi:aspartate racemase
VDGIMRNQHWRFGVAAGTMVAMNPAPLSRSSRLPRIGVLGGMGPMATADFLAKLTRATPAQRDQDHFPVTIESASHIPDRVAALEGRGEDPLPALLAVAQRLVDAGCDLIAMPCNTAHLWHAAIAAQVSVPILHIADAVAERLGAVQVVGLMGTTATLASGLYQQRMGSGLGWVLPTPEEMQSQVMPGVAAVKRDDMPAARALLRPVAQRLAAGGVGALVLGCTEIPLALSQADVDVPVIDATAALAEATVAAAMRWMQSGVAGAVRQAA